MQLHCKAVSAKLFMDKMKGHSPFRMNMHRHSGQVFTIFIAQQVPL